MARIAGDNPGYQFRLVSTHDKDNLIQMTEFFFELPSVTTVINDVLGKPAGAMAWWGYRLGLEGVMKLDAAARRELTSAEDLEAVLKDAGIDPNKATKQAGRRGTRAHDVLELLANGDRDKAEDLAAEEFTQQGTRYCYAVITWWGDQNFGDLNVKVSSERPVWSLRHGYCGTLDLALEFAIGWEVIDLKTHKPAAGFTKPGQGPAYLSDLLQIRAYRTAWEEMGLGETIGSRVVIARENGKYLEDYRTVDEALWLRVLEVHRLMQAFEEGE